MKRIAYNLSLLILTSCSVWEDEFSEPVPRALPRASIHRISTLIDNGVIKNEDERTVSTVKTGKAPMAFFDGIYRGREDVRRIYLLPYEDTDQTLHTAHHLYAVVKPAEWRYEAI